MLQFIEFFRVQTCMYVEPTRIVTYSNSDCRSNVVRLSYVMCTEAMCSLFNRVRHTAHGLPYLAVGQFIYHLIPPIYYVAEASDFKFGMQLGFATAHHEIREKRENSPGLRKLPKILGSLLIFL